MSLAKEVNKLLDELSASQADLDEIKKEYKQNPNFNLKDHKTGEAVTKEIVLNKAGEAIHSIKDQLDKVTRNGENCRDLFTNIYYVNDFSQDKQITNELNTNNNIVNKDDLNKNEINTNKNLKK